MKAGIQAEIIKHSISSISKDELITIQIKAPKFLDAEIEKHRMISSNSSSDRAVPFNKMINSEYYIPDDVRLNEPGMQGSKSLSGLALKSFQYMLHSLRDHTIKELNNWNNVHKQHLNRYLMPWSYQNKIMTANKDQWIYFIELRLSEGADPAMQQLTWKINKAISESTPKKLNPGKWHLPFIDNIICSDCIKISVARCARISYNNHDEKLSSIGEDLKLYNKLKELKHLTPFEHQATPMISNFYHDILWNKWQDGISHMDKKGLFWSGNFKGFIQNRKLQEAQL